jgi:hypothetical protein
MKTVRLIKITASGRKIVTMQESIWNTILKDSSMLPHGVSYELAPIDKFKANTIELLADKVGDIPEKNNIEFNIYGGGSAKGELSPFIFEEVTLLEDGEEVEPIQVFTPEMVMESTVELIKEVDATEKKAPKKAVKRQTKKRK